MVNRPADIKIVAAPFGGPLLVEMMGFEPMTSELETGFARERFFTRNQRRQMPGSYQTARP
ncbi:hypothetical protein D6Y74_23650 [Salmonella enterica]|nr:hypothetical protein [Salmonella enterica subsp. enterica serovar Liverpool]EEW2546602.1 hypothetical protein [Escherichia coli]